jgi:hypothetical protein
MKILNSADFIENMACVIFPFMGMSRRQFFRGFTGKEGPSRRLNRAAAVDAYVRTNLLPYDFCLTDEQVEHLLRTVRCELTGGDGSEFSTEERQRMAAIAHETIQTWREDYWKAEEKRRDAIALVREFLHTEAAPEAIERMRDRFQIPSFKTLEDEIERLALSWLYALPNARLAPLNSVELKDLVFSEMNIWCQPNSG